MDTELKKKANSLMYEIFKEAARYSFAELLERHGISDEEYKEIKAEFAKIGITDTYL